MQPRLYLIFLLLSFAAVCRAQVPQHIAGSSAAGNYFPFGSTDGKGTRVQLLYKPSDFAALPRDGTITRIYFKADNSAESEGLASYRDLMLRIAGTGLTSLPADGSSFHLPMITVFEAVAYETHFKRGQWLSFTLQQPFSYSDTANLLIELSVARASAMRYIGSANSNDTRRIWGRAGTTHADGNDTRLYALGLDIAPLQMTAAHTSPSTHLMNEETSVLHSQDVVTNKPDHETSAPSISTLSSNAAAVTPVETDPIPARRNGNKWLVLGTALLAALGLGTLFPLLPRTRRLASWAVHHPKKAKGWLFGLQFLGSIAALYTGVKLYDYGIATSDASTTALLALSTIATMLYPRSRGNDMWKAYARQKMAGVAVVASGFGLLAGVGNRCASDRDFCAPASYVITQMDSQHYERSARGTYDTPVNTGDLAWKIFASIMILALLAALLFGVAVLACGVYCVIALEATSTATIVGGAIAGGVVGGLGVFGVVKLFLYFKRVIWGRKYRN